MTDTATSTDTEELLSDLRSRTAGLESLDSPLPKKRPQVSAFAH